MMEQVSEVPVPKQVYKKAQAGWCHVVGGWDQDMSKILRPVSEFAHARMPRPRRSTFENS